MKIAIRVKANKKENRVNLPEVFVKEPAKEGKANQAVIKLLAEYFKVPKSQISIISGLQSKNKIININQ